MNFGSDLSRTPYQLSCLGIFNYRNIRSVSIILINFLTSNTQVLLFILAFRHIFTYQKNNSCHPTTFQLTHGSTNMPWQKNPVVRIFELPELHQKSFICQDQISTSSFLFYHTLHSSIPIVMCISHWNQIISDFAICDFYKLFPSLIQSLKVS